MTVGTQYPDVRRPIISPIAVDVLDFERNVSGEWVSFAPPTTFAFFASGRDDVSTYRAIILELARPRAECSTLRLDFSAATVQAERPDSRDIRHACTSSQCRVPPLWHPATLPELSVYAPVFGQGPDNPGKRSGRFGLALKRLQRISTQHHRHSFRPSGGPKRTAVDDVVAAVNRSCAT